MYVLYRERRGQREGEVQVDRGKDLRDTSAAATSRGENYGPVPDIWRRRKVPSRVLQEDDKL